MISTAKITLNSEIFPPLIGQIFPVSNNIHTLTSSNIIPIAAIQRTMLHVNQIIGCLQSRQLRNRADWRVRVVSGKPQAEI